MGSVRGANSAHLGQNSSSISIHLRVPGAFLHPARWCGSLFNTCLRNQTSAGWRSWGTAPQGARGVSFKTGHKAKLAWATAVKRQRCEGKMGGVPHSICSWALFSAFLSERSPVASYLKRFKSSSCLPGLTQDSFQNILQSHSWQEYISLPGASTDISVSRSPLITL